MKKSYIASAQHNLSSSINPFLSLDGIRGISAIIIACFYHYCVYFECIPLSQLSSAHLSHFFAFITRFGYLGVEVFFVISGFSLYKGYYSRIQNNEISFSAYMGKRLLRLLPLHYFTAIIIFFLQQYSLYQTGAYIIHQNNDLYHLLISFFNLQSNFGESLNAPSWFLTPIVVCYILFYLLAKYSKRNFLWTSLAVIILGIMLIYQNYSFPFLYKYCGRGYLSFFWGVVLAMLLQKSENPTVLKKNLSIAISLLFILLCYYAFERDSLIGSVVSPFATLYTTATFLLCTALLLLACYSKFFSAIVGNRFFRWLGKISYSIYLWNFPLVFVFIYISKYISGYSFNTLYCWFIFLLVTIFFSAFSHYIIEPLLNKLADKLIHTI